MQEVHFCSGSVFVTGDDIAMSLLKHVQAVSTARLSAVLTVPAVTLAGAPAAVTLMINAVSQISAGSIDRDGSELEDAAFVARLDASTREISTSSVWLGVEDLSAA